MNVVRFLPADQTPIIHFHKVSHHFANGFKNWFTPKTCDLVFQLEWLFGDQISGLLELYNPADQ